MRCVDCKHWDHEAAKVVAGSRRVLSRCRRAQGPRVKGGGELGRTTYDFWDLCTVGEEHGNETVDELLRISIRDQNAALDEQYPKEDS